MSDGISIDGIDQSKKEKLTESLRAGYPNRGIYFTGSDCSLWTLDEDGNHIKIKEGQSEVFVDQDVLDAGRDISSESIRIYHYGEGRKIVIKEPKVLYIKKGGTGHRILTKHGAGFWVPVNVWHYITWEASDGVRF